MTQQFPQPGPFPEQPRKRRRWPWWVGGAFAALVGLVILGNIVGPPPARNTAGSEQLTTAQAPPPATTTTTTAPVTTTSAPTPTTTVPTTTTTVAPPPVTTTVAAPPPAPEPVQQAAMCAVPNVVGLVHQTAQDTMQGAGLFMLREVDATGRGRALLVDRNWQTVAQSVPAGAVVDCMTEVVLSAKKIGE